MEKNILLIVNILSIVPSSLTIEVSENGVGVSREQFSDII